MANKDALDMMMAISESENPLQHCRALAQALDAYLEVLIEDEDPGEEGPTLKQLQDASRTAQKLARQFKEMTR